MAIVKNPSLGGYSGRVGNHVFRIVKGKTRVSLRPVEFHASYSAKAKRARNDFAASVKLAKAVNLVPALKNIWNSSEIKGFSAYHKIIKTNSALVKDGNLTTKNIITPEGLFLEITSLSIQSNTLKTELKFPESTGIKFPAEVFFLFGFQELENTFLSISEIINEPAPGGEYTLSTSLNSRVKTLLKEDSHPFIFIAFAGSLPSRKKVYWSSSAAVKI
jgi:hypothetical protein